MLGDEGASPASKVVLLQYSDSVAKFAQSRSQASASSAGTDDHNVLPRILSGFDLLCFSAHASSALMRFVDTLHWRRLEVTTSSLSKSAQLLYTATRRVFHLPQVMQVEAERRVTVHIVAERIDRERSCSEMVHLLLTEKRAHYILLWTTESDVAHVWSRPGRLVRARWATQSRRTVGPSMHAMRTAGKPLP